jgi:hypothetical protein
MASASPGSTRSREQGFVDRKRQEGHGAGWRSVVCTSTALTFTQTSAFSFAIAVAKAKAKAEDLANNLTQENLPGSQGGSESQLTLRLQTFRGPARRPRSAQSAARDRPTPAAETPVSGTPEAPPILS